MLGIDGLRYWPLRRFPQLVFYIERAAQIDVVHLLHGRQDIPSWLDDADDTA